MSDTRNPCPLCDAGIPHHHALQKAPHDPGTAGSVNHSGRDEAPTT